MRGNRSRDTGPELALRRLLHARGLRYLVDSRPEPDLNRRADVVFRGPKVAVFVHGCFWHGCHRHYQPPKTNDGYWSEKVMRNKQRDAHTRRRLRARGWTVITVWEHDDMRGAAERIELLVRGNS